MTTQLVLETPKRQALETSRFIKQSDCRLLNSDVTEPFLSPCHSSASTMFSIRHPFTDPDVEEDIPLMNIAHDIPGSDSNQVHSHLSNGCNGERMRVSSTGSDQSSSGQTPETVESLSSSTDEVMNVESHLDSIQNAFHTKSFSLLNSGRENALSEPGHLNVLGGSSMIVVNGLDNPLGDCMEVTSFDSDTGPASLEENFHNRHTGRDSPNVIGGTFQTCCEFSESVAPSNLKNQAPEYQEHLKCGEEPADASVVLFSDPRQVPCDETFDDDLNRHFPRGKSKDKKSVRLCPQGNVNFSYMNQEKAAPQAASPHSYQISTTSSNTAASTTSPELQQQPSHSSSVRVETDSSKVSSTRGFENSPQNPINSNPQHLHHGTPLLCPHHMYGLACSGFQNGQLPAASHVLALDSTWQPTAALLCSSPFMYYNSNVTNQNEVTTPIINPSEVPFQVMIPVSCGSANPLPQYSNSHLRDTFSENPKANQEERSNSEQKVNVEHCSNAHAPEMNPSTKEKPAPHSNHTIPRDPNEQVRHTPILQVMVPRCTSSSVQNNFNSNPNAFSRKPGQNQTLHMQNLNQAQTGVESTIQTHQPMAGSYSSDISNQTPHNSIPTNPSQHQGCEVVDPSPVTFPVPLSSFHRPLASACKVKQEPTETPIAIGCEGQNVTGVSTTSANCCSPELQTQEAQLGGLADPHGGKGCVSKHTRDYTRRHDEMHFLPGQIIRVHESSFADDYLIEIPLRQNQEDKQSSSLSDDTDLKSDGCCTKDPVPLCYQAPHLFPCGTQDHDVPDYRCLSILACLVNPVVGVLGLVTNALAKHYHRRHKYNYAQNLYMATIVLGSLAIYSAIMIPCLVAILLQDCNPDPLVKPKLCTPQVHNIMDHFGMDEELYCRNMNNPLIRNALMSYFSFANMNTTRFSSSQDTDITLSSSLNNSTSNDSYRVVPPVPSVTADKENGTDYPDDYSSSSLNPD